MSKERNGDHFESLFEYAPISLWEEDFSGIKKFLDELRMQGVAKLERYLDEHPAVVDESLSLIQVTHVNRETLHLFGAKSEEELLSNLSQIFRDEMRAHWR